jgi:hypothetical protein
MTMFKKHHWKHRRELDAVLLTAEPGDTILLEPGRTYTGNFVLPCHGGGDPITITTDGPIPPQGTRITPETAAPLAKLQAAPGGMAAIRTAPGAAFWNVVGVDILPNPGGHNDLIAFGDGSDAQSDREAIPHHLLLDRCSLHGDPTHGQRRGVSLHAGETIIRDCDIRGMFAPGQDSQAIAGWNGPGPWLIDNNYLSAASENFLVGGDTIRIADLLPSDITFTRNTVAKDRAWRGKGYNVKNLLELKTGVRVVIEDNTFDHNWAGEGQSGYAIVFTVRNEYGANPWATIKDVRFRRNIVRHSAGWLNILGLDDRGAAYPSVLLSGLLVEDNLAVDINQDGGGAGHFAQIQRGDRITLNHNTVILEQEGQAVSLYLLNAPQSHFVCTNNIFPNHGLTIFGDHGKADGVPTLDEHAPGWTVARNVVYGPWASNYPPDTAFAEPDITAVGFVDPAAGDYALAPTSPYVDAALDGTNIGARLDRPTPPPRPEPEFLTCLNCGAKYRYIPPEATA